ATKRAPTPHTTSSILTVGVPLKWRSSYPIVVSADAPHATGIWVSRIARFWLELLRTPPPLDCAVSRRRRDVRRPRYSPVTKVAVPSLVVVVEVIEVAPGGTIRPWPPLKLVSANV